MGTGTSPTVRIALSLTLPVLLIAALTFLRGSDETTELPAIDEPQFLTWQGEPYDDGLNHFIVTLDDSTAEKQQSLYRDANGTLTVDEGASGGITVTVDELNNVLADGSVSHVAATETAERLRTVPGVSEVRTLGFGFAAVSGTIDAVALEGAPGVLGVNRDPALVAATLDEYYPSQWALENDGASPENWPLLDDADIDAPEGWHRTRGAGVIVAVIDSGVDIGHPDLAANIWRNPGEVCGNDIDDDGNGYVDDCHGWDFAAHDPDVEDLNGHGTHVAGIIAAEANNGIGIAGVAYESTVMPLKIGDQTPALSAAVEAFGYAIDNGARVINASWIVEDVNAATYLDPVLEAAEAAGVLVVAGAGNSGNNIDSHPVYPASSTSPNVIAVGASTPQDERAPYSGFGPTSVDLFAPGEHIASTMPGGSYGAYSGTSMAAPMVSGAAALLWAATPSATPAEVKGALLDRSDGPNDGISSFRNLAFSDGRLNIERAIYSRLFRPPLMFTFHDFNGFEPDLLHTVRVQAQTIDPWIAHPQTPSKYRVGLYVPQNGQPMAVTGYPVTHVQDGTTTTVLTDGTGRTVIGEVFEPQQRPALVQDGDITTLQLELPMGTYALVMEIVDVTDPADPVNQGDPSAVFFFVGPDGSITEMPGLPLGGGATDGGGAGGDQPGTTVADTGESGDAPATTSATTPPPDSGDGGTGGECRDAECSTGGGNDADPDGQDADSGDPTPGEIGGGTETTTTTTAPPDGDATTTTSTTIPGGGVPLDSTTTTPPTTTPSETTTTTVAPSPGVRITDVDPTFGPTAGGTLVTITGVEMPEDPTVRIGERTATVVAVAAPTFIVVETPPGAAGPVDVWVEDRESDDAAVLTGGFLYTDDETGIPEPTTTTTDPGAPSSTAPPDTTTPPTTDGMPPDEPGGLESAIDLDTWLGGMLVTPEGLNLAPVAQDSPIASIPVLGWVGVLCDEPVCPGWVLED